MSAPRCYRLTFWDALPGMPGYLTTSLVHGSREFPTRQEAENFAVESFAKSPAYLVDLSAVYRRSTRLLGKFSQGAPGTPSAVWHEARK